ncbi:glycosyltransferase [Klebsiella sp. RHBSTW-00465]|uniref:glycosyltransferase n=1 Tax=Klebsiella sp. RHBSTW-00465 TaxID=2742650 RepID=UPI0015F3D1C7|nr:glycosyltransferase [Klebsiella sp. RHBSTW-00465]MBA7847947.1 glycosyltransferase [Klebsiella sp. RHBSTW-00465]
MKKKVLFITSRTDMGGGPKHLLQLIENIDNENFEVYLACPTNKPFYQRYQEKVDSGNFFLLEHRVFNFKYLYKLHIFCKRNNILIIHSHGRCAGVFSRFLKLLCAKRLIIHTFHGLNIAEDKSLKTLVRNSVYIFTEKLFSLYTDNFIYVSKGEEAIAVSKGIVKNIEKNNVIINGVHIPETPPIKSPKSKSIMKFVVISRFDFQKNTELLIDVLKKMDEVFINVPEKIVFNILGEGEDLYKLKEVIRGMGKIEVFLHGNVNDPYEFFDESDFVLNTSRWEGLPLSVIESMARGCIPILTDVVGNRDIVENSILMDNLFSSPEAVVKVIEKYLADNIMYHAHVIKTRQLVQENFNEKTMCNRTFELYN